MSCQMGEQRWVALREFAKMIGKPYSVDYLRVLARQGKLPTIRVGRRLFVDLWALPRGSEGGQETIDPARAAEIYAKRVEGLKRARAVKAAKRAQNSKAAEDQR